ncbi:glycosyltransferase involved in cell wall biosynthesis [Methanofollis sp. W23]|uniref:glycosyltransferase family 4 protein n=1 Tax=Methanofollis sp. W23 TaxID=2817849 RepID=UPI001AE8FED6|nr:glycosyltransferase family 4 protein [Methanofollis sp. W23]MBP2144591.1 glycosyltransferase involved in cell wall biosynthesis [Methanofollis sp. W23]
MPGPPITDTQVRPRVVLVTSRWFRNQNLYYTALKLVRILCPLSRDVTWILTQQPDKTYPPGECALVRVPDLEVERPYLARAWYLALHQARVTRQILRLARDQDVVVFAFGADYFVLPMLAAKVAGKRVLLRTDARTSEVIRRSWRQKNPALVFLYRCIEAVTYAAADAIVPESPAFIDLYDLTRHPHKTFPGSLYVDTARFTPKKPLAAREYVFGYVGRFSEEKGTREYVRALIAVLAAHEGRAVVIGDGPLREEVETRVARAGMDARIDLPGWVENTRLHEHLNEIQVLVVPSFKEGLPNIVLEAMACGCVVLATPVGGVPDLITDGVTGFIAPDNDPATLRQCLEQVRGHADLAGIGRAARLTIEEGYTYEAAVGQYQKILQAVRG